MCKSVQLDKGRTAEVKSDQMKLRNRPKDKWWIWGLFCPISWKVSNNQVICASAGEFIKGKSISWWTGVRPEIDLTFDLLCLKRIFWTLMFLSKSSLRVRVPAWLTRVNAGFSLEMEGTRTCAWRLVDVSAAVQLMSFQLKSHRLRVLRSGQTCPGWSHPKGPHPEPPPAASLHL